MAVEDSLDPRLEVARRRHPGFGGLQGLQVAAGLGELVDRLPAGDAGEEDGLGQLGKFRDLLENAGVGAVGQGQERGKEAAGRRLGQRPGRFVVERNPEVGGVEAVERQQRFRGQDRDLGGVDAVYQELFGAGQDPAGLLDGVGVGVVFGFHRGRSENLVRNPAGRGLRQGDDDLYARVGGGFEETDFGRRKFAEAVDQEHVELHTRPLGHEVGGEVAAVVGVLAPVLQGLVAFVDPLKAVDLGIQPGGHLVGGVAEPLQFGDGPGEEAGLARARGRTQLLGKGAADQGDPRDQVDRRAQPAGAGEDAGVELLEVQHFETYPPTRVRGDAPERVRSRVGQGQVPHAFALGQVFGGDAREAVGLARAVGAGDQFHVGS